MDYSWVATDPAILSSLGREVELDEGGEGWLEEDGGDGGPYYSHGSHLLSAPAAHQRLRFSRRETDCTGFVRAGFYPRIVPTQSFHMQGKTLAAEIIKPQ